MMSVPANIIIDLCGIHGCSITEAVRIYKLEQLNNLLGTDLPDNSGLSTGAMRLVINRVSMVDPDMAMALELIEDLS